MRQYELNIACGGLHWARVILPSSLTEQQTIERARAIVTALKKTYPGGAWHFSLTRFEPRIGIDIDLEARI